MRVSDLTGPMDPQQQLGAEAEMVSNVAGQGLVVDVDPDTATVMGAFADDALDPDAAEASRFDELAGEDE